MMGGDAKPRSGLGMGQPERLFPYTYWPAPQEGEPHIAYCYPKSAVRLSGLALLGLPLVALGLPGVLAMTAWAAALGRMAHAANQRDAGFYEVDGQGTPIRLLSDLAPPEAIGGRRPMRRATFLRRVNR
jgi:hypothetical protein